VLISVTVEQGLLERGTVEVVSEKKRRALTGLVWLACSLGLPWLLVGVGLSWLLLPVVLLATAASVQTGGVLLDRLMAALLLLCGEVLLLGLLMSVWPWGLSVPLSCSVLLLVAGLWWWCAGRLPRLPLRFRLSDLAVLGTGAFVLWRLALPVAGLSPAAQLDFNGEAPDAYVHFAIFDAVQRIPGFLFLHAEHARQYVMTPTETSYPQGSHFLLAWVDLVLHGGRVEPDVLISYTWLFHAMLVVVALLCAATVWAARWIGGPRLRGWRAGAVCGLVGGLLVASPLVGLIVQGFYSEAVGLLFLVLASALATRAAMPMPERTAVLITGAVATAYCYNLFVVVLGLALVAHVILQRHRIRAAIWWWAPTVLLGLAAAAFPTFISVTTSLNVGAQSMQQGGDAATESPVFLGTLCLLLLAALIRPALRGFAVARSAVLVVASAAVLLGAYGAYQYLTLHKLAYYFQKSATGTAFVLLAMLGAVGWLLRPEVSLPRLRFGGVRTGRVVNAGLALAACTAGLMIGVNAQWGAVAGTDIGANAPTVTATGPSNPSVSTTLLGSVLDRLPLMAWSRGRVTVTPPDPGVNFINNPSILRATGTIIMLDTPNGWSNRRNSILADTLQHRQGSLAALNGALHGIDMGTSVPSRASYRRSLDALVLAVRATGGEPVTVYVGDRRLAARLAHDLPPLDGRAHVTIVYLPVASASGKT
jgi:hypothetical protein